MPTRKEPRVTELIGEKKKKKKLALNYRKLSVFRVLNQIWR